MITQFAEWWTVLADMTMSIVIVNADWTVIVCTVKHVITATSTDACQHEQFELVFGTDCVFLICVLHLGFITLVKNNMLLASTNESKLVTRCTRDMFNIEFWLVHLVV